MPGVALAAEEPVLNSGDTAWMLISTALVLLTTIPGLALFYGGMVRAKNVLSIMMQCFAITGLITILWVVYGYSLAFDTTGMEKGVLNFNSFVGGLDKAFLSGLTADGLTSATALVPGKRVHHLPDDLRDHHSGADRRRLRRAHEVLGDADLHGGLVHRGLRADRAWSGAVTAP